MQSLLAPVFEPLAQTFGFAPAAIAGIAILALAALLALLLHAILHKVVLRFLARRWPASATFVVRLRGFSRFALLVFFIGAALPFAPFPADMKALLGRLIGIAFIVTIGWASLLALRIGADLYLSRFRLDVADNQIARKQVTQMRVLLRAAQTLIVMVTAGAALMTFEAVRQYGVSLFASAGVAGLVVGLAARPVLSNLFAGVQLAITQPIRIEDAIIVENEYGWVEEITSTYVVVRLWDLRRLVLPLSYFIEKPFQNWTRSGAAVLGTVMLYLDYNAPVDAIRDKLNEIVSASSLWNGKVAGVQVTDCKEFTIELRLLVSADNASAAWDLRCLVREQVIAFLRREHPEALPRVRQFRFAGNDNERIAREEMLAQADPEPRRQSSRA